MELISNVPAGPIQQSWDKHKFALRLINPANKRKYNIIVVGSGLAGGAAAASFGELGYNVQCFCYPRQPAPCPLHCGPGRHQRREELSQ